MNKERLGLFATERNFDVQRAIFHFLLSVNVRWRKKNCFASGKWNCVGATSSSAVCVHVLWPTFLVLDWTKTLSTSAEPWEPAHKKKSTAEPDICIRNSQFQRPRLLNYKILFCRTNCLPLSQSPNHTEMRKYGDTAWIGSWSIEKLLTIKHLLPRLTFPPLIFTRGSRFRSHPCKVSHIYFT